MDLFQCSFFLDRLQNIFITLWFVNVTKSQPSPCATGPRKRFTEHIPSMYDRKLNSYKHQSADDTTLLTPHFRTRGWMNISHSRLPILSQFRMLFWLHYETRKWMSIALPGPATLSCFFLAFLTSFKKVFLHLCVSRLHKHLYQKIILWISDYFYGHVFIQQHCFFIGNSHGLFFDVGQYFLCLVFWGSLYLAYGF